MGKIVEFGENARRALFVAGIWLTASTANAEPVAFEMRPGDTLWDIASDHLDLPARWKDVIETNAIDRPQDMSVGSSVNIEREWFQTEPMAVEIVDMVGIVNIDDRTGRSVARVGQLLQPSGKTLETSANGRLTLAFDNGCTITLEPESSLLLERVQYLGKRLIPDIGVRLVAGQATVTYPNQGLNRGEIRVRTKSAVTAVRGTTFRAAFDADAGKARSETLSGEVAFGNSLSRVQLGQEQGSVAEADKAPLAPIPLLTPPEFVELPTTARVLPLTIELASVSGAAAYRVKLHPAGQPLQIRAEHVIAENRLEIDNLDDGPYAISVRSIDEQGLEGIDRQQTLEIDAKPHRPLIKRPIIDGRIAEPDPEFAWTVDESRLRFRFELADNRSFNPILHVREGLESARHQLPFALAPGNYYWRVASTDVAGDTGLPSQIGAFSYRPAPGQVNAEFGIAENGRIEGRWQPVDGAVRYLVERAKDSDFQQILIAQETVATSIELGRPTADGDWLRVRAIDVDGVAGAPSQGVIVVSEPESLWLTIGLPVALLLLLL